MYMYIYIYTLSVYTSGILYIHTQTHTSGADGLVMAGEHLKDNYTQDRRDRGKTEWMQVDLMASSRARGTSRGTYGSLYCL